MNTFNCCQHVVVGGLDLFLLWTMFYESILNLKYVALKPMTWFKLTLEMKCLILAKRYNQASFVFCILGGSEGGLMLTHGKL